MANSRKKRSGGSCCSTLECTVNLFKAVCRGNVQECKKWLKSGADPRQICPRRTIVDSDLHVVEMNPIQAAVWNGEAGALREIIAWLKQRHEEIHIEMDLNAPYMRIGRLSLLESAVMTRNVEVVRVLLDAGLDPSSVLKFAQSRRSDEVILLLEARAGMIPTDTKPGVEVSARLSHSSSYGWSSASLGKQISNICEVVKGNHKAEKELSENLSLTWQKVRIRGQETEHILAVNDHLQQQCDQLQHENAMLKQKVAQLESHCELQHKYIRHTRKSHPQPREFRRSYPPQQAQMIPNLLGPMREGQFPISTALPQPETGEPCEVCSPRNMAAASERYTSSHARLSVQGESNVVYQYFISNNHYHQNTRGEVREEADKMGDAYIDEVFT